MSEAQGYLPIIVIRLVEPAPEGDDLRELAERAGYRGLAALLDERPDIDAARAIQSVSPKDLLYAEQRARDSDYPPLHSLTSFWRLDCSAIPDAVEELIEDLSKLPEIGLAYQESDTTEPAPVTNPGQNPRYANNEQGYLAAAPNGIGVTSAWALVDGSGVGFADIERCWRVSHEDLAGLVPVVLNGNDTSFASSARHGAAVLGIVAGRHNTLGVIGIAPGVTGPRLSTQYIGAATPNVAGAVSAAVLGPSALAPGDVLLIEVQLPPDFRPAESENLTFSAIRLASALGIIVIEAAGNGSFDLALTLPVFDPTSPSFQGDSGAIIVAGGTSTVPHGRAGNTNFGARIDCYAWGQNVTTVSGGGELTPAAVEDQRYTGVFDGTSAAAAIVAGAALLLQDVYQRPTPTRPGGGRLSPRHMRALLKANPGSTDCAAGAAIGRMPDLGQLVTVLGTIPDLYIRDDIGDAGSVPSAGAVSVSPDVVVSKTNVSPATAFAAGGSEVETGQDNFVYVRVSNRNSVAADDAEVTVYWSQVSTLIAPNDWKRLNPPPLGTAPTPDALIDVPASATLVAAPTITWESGNLPAAGHYCFVATVHHQLDPQPDHVSFTWPQFVAYIRNYNSVTWRNFDVVDVPAGGDGAAADFLVAGAPDEDRVFDLEILLSEPEAVRVRWELPLELFDALDADLEADIDEKRSLATAFLPSRPKLALPEVMLKRSVRHRCRFVLDATDLLSEVRCTLAVSQFWEGTEVGRVTWELRAER